MPEPSLFMNTPTTQTRARRLRFREEVWTAVRVDNPGIALISTEKYLGVLLARNVRVGRRVTILRGVQWVRIPQGWRLRWLQWRSLLIRARLPDEWLFTRVRIEQAGDFWIARLPGARNRKEVLPTPSEKPYPIRVISAAQFEGLAQARGRELRLRVLALFAGHVGERQTLLLRWWQWLTNRKGHALFGQ